MELIRENIHMEVVSGEGEVQITLEDDLNLPEKKPDVSTLCMEKGNIVIEEVRPGTDQVMVKGRLCFSVLYHTNEDGGRLACTEGKIPFEEKIRVEGLAGTDTVNVCGEVSDLSVSMINSRKLSVQAIVTLTATVEEIQDETLPTGIDVEDGEEGNPQFRLQPLEFTQVCLCRKDVLRVREEIELPAGYPNIGQILWKSVEFGEMNFRLGDEKLWVQGELRIFVLYESEDGATAPQIFETVIPVSEEIACSGCHGKETMDVRYGMAQCEITPGTDADGEQRVFGLDAVIELKMCAYEDRNLQVMTDIYGVTEEINGEKKTAHLEKLLRAVTGKAKLNDQIKLSEGSKVLQLIHSDAQVVLSDTEVTKDGILLHGSMHVKILYVTGDDEKPYGCIRTVIPFEYLLEIPGMTPEVRFGRIRTELEQLGVTMPDGEQMEVKAVICFTTTAAEPISEEVIGSVSETPLENEKMAALPGMVVYVVKEGDNLWDIGKKYYVPVETLVEMNDLDSQDVQTGQKILVVR